MNTLSELIKVVNVLNYTSIPTIYDFFLTLGHHVGEYKWSSRTEDFYGWMICDGRSVSRKEYKQLFNIIGTTFGADDDDTFKLPDMRGRVMGCIGQGAGLTARTLGDMVGSEKHTLTTNELPSHSHNGTTDAGGSHTHTASASTNGAHAHGGSSGNAGAHTHTINDPGHTHTQTTVNDDFNNSGTNPPGFTADSAGTMT